MLPFTRRVVPAPAEGKQLSFYPINYYLQHSEWYALKILYAGWQPLIRLTILSTFPSKIRVRPCTCRMNEIIMHFCLWHSEKFIEQGHWMVICLVVKVPCLLRHFPFAITLHIYHTRSLTETGHQTIGKEYVLRFLKTSPFHGHDQGKK